MYYPKFQLLLNGQSIHLDGLWPYNWVLQLVLIEEEGPEI